MTNKSTKRSLLASIIAMFLCFTMLLGTTFAWFTDSAASSNNVITAGNFDLVVEYTLDGKSWDTLDGADDLFQGGPWEPGHTEVAVLRIKNNGTLALKYAANMNIFSETVGKTTDDEDIVLSEILTVSTLVQENVQLEDVFGSESSVTYDRTSTFKAGNVLGSNVELLSGKTHYLVVKVDMAETVGNVANHNGTDIPAITFGINVIAAQFTYEDDSYGDQYDKDAEYPVIFDAKVDAGMSFEDFSKIFTEGGNILITEDITVANPESSRFTKFDLTKNVGIYLEEDATLTFGETTTLVGEATITVYGGSIVEKQELCVAENTTIVFEGGEHSFNAFSASGNGAIIVNDGVLNCRGSFAGIMGITFAENGSLIVNGGRLNMYQPFNLNQNRCDGAYIEINGGTIDLLDGIENLFVVRNIMNKDREAGGVLRGSSIRVNGGTFIAHYEIDSAGDATSFIRNGDAPSDTNKVLVSNTFNGAADYNCLVTGGVFYGSWQRADNQRYINGNGGYSDGLFVENSIAGFVANGYQISGDATNGYIVSMK